MKKKLLFIVIFIMAILVVASGYQALNKEEKETPVAIKVTKPTRSIVNKVDLIRKSGIWSIEDTKPKDAGKYYIVASDGMTGGAFSGDNGKIEENPSASEETTESSGIKTTHYNPANAQISYVAEEDGYFYFIELFIPKDSDWQMKDVSLQNPRTGKRYSYNKELSLKRGMVGDYQELLIAFEIPKEQYADKEETYKVVVSYDGEKQSFEVKLPGRDKEKLYEK